MKCSVWAVETLRGAARPCPSRRGGAIESLTVEPMQGAYASGIQFCDQTRTVTFVVSADASTSATIRRVSISGQNLAARQPSPC